MPINGKCCVYVTYAKFRNTEKQMPECPALSLREKHNIQRTALRVQLRICNAGREHGTGREKQAAEQEEEEEEEVVE